MPRQIDQLPSGDQHDFVDRVSEQDSSIFNAYLRLGERSEVSIHVGNITRTGHLILLTNVVDLFTFVRMIARFKCGDHLPISLASVDYAAARF